MPYRSQSRSAAQLKHLDKQGRKLWPVLTSKLVDGREVRMLAARKNSERHVLVRRTFDLARREHAHRVPVQQESRHHPWRVRTRAAPVLSLDLLLEPAQAQLSDHLEDEVRKMPLR